jgi:hypothetical protein
MVEENRVPEVSPPMFAWKLKVGTCSIFFNYEEVVT